LAFVVQANDGLVHKGSVLELSISGKVVLLPGTVIEEADEVVLGLGFVVELVDDGVVTDVKELVLHFNVVLDSGQFVLEFLAPACDHRPVDMKIGVVCKLRGPFYDNGVLLGERSSAVCEAVLSFLYYRSLELLTVYGPQLELELLEVQQVKFHIDCCCCLSVSE